MIEASWTEAKLPHPSVLNEVKTELKSTPARIMQIIAPARNPKHRSHPNHFTVDF